MYDKRMIHFKAACPRRWLFIFSIFNI